VESPHIKNRLVPGGWRSWQCVVSVAVFSLAMHEWGALALAKLGWLQVYCTWQKGAAKEEGTKEGLV
jgi:hypothetical protein